MRQDIPFEFPHEKSKSPVETKLTQSQQDMYDHVLAHFLNLDQLPISQSQKKKMAPLSESERWWLSRECILRYLRATKWHVEHAIKRLESTLVWRRTFGVDPESTLTPEMIEMENETGKEVIMGFDLDNRPCLYLKPGRQNTKASHRQVQHLVYMLERVIDFMVPGQDELALLIDFQPADVGFKAPKLPSLSTGREVLNILQNHYPERLGKALLTNIPKLGWVFLKLINPFIDHTTREKLVFVGPYVTYVPPEQLDIVFGGKIEFEYHHKIYWPKMVEMATARRKHAFNRWREMGGQIGLSEYKMHEGFVP